MNGNMSICCSAFGFIYFDIIPTLSNVFTCLNYNAWKTGTSRKQLFILRLCQREKQELELKAKRGEKVAWLNASSLPLTAQKKKEI